MKQIKVSCIPHWSKVETRNAAFVMPKYPVFCTLNFSTPVWKLKKFRTIFLALQNELEEKRLFYSHFLYWDVGKNGLHCHILGNGVRNIDQLRIDLSKLWNSLFYRKGNVYAVFYVGNKDKQKSYFSMDVARLYMREKVDRNIALQRGWKKTGLYINFPRVFYTKSYLGGNGHPIRANIFSPYTLLGDKHIQAIERYRLKIGCMVQLKLCHSAFVKRNYYDLSRNLVDRWVSGVKRFLFYNNTAFTANFKYHNSMECEIYFPAIDKVSAILLETYGRKLWQRITSKKIYNASRIEYYSIDTPQSYFVILKRVHGKIAVCRGDVVIDFKSTNARVTAPTTLSSKETKLRYFGHKKPVGVLALTQALTKTVGNRIIAWTCDVGEEMDRWEKFLKRELKQRRVRANIIVVGHRMNGLSSKNVKNILPFPVESKQVVNIEIGAYAFLNSLEENDGSRRIRIK